MEQTKKKYDVSDIGASGGSSGQVIKVGADGNLGIGSIEFRNGHYTVTSSSWSATVDANDYYTYSLTLTEPYNGYKGIFYVLSGSTTNTLPTADEEAAYNLVDKMDYTDSTSVTTVTLYATVKPTTTFYIDILGYYIS